MNVQVIGAFDSTNFLGKVEIVWVTENFLFFSEIRNIMQPEYYQLWDKLTQHSVPHQTNNNLFDQLFIY